MVWENYDYLCRKAGTSANAVAALCGVKSTGTVSNWKNGAMPNAKTLAAIAEYFGISIEDLTGEFIPAKRNAPASDGEREVTDDDLMFGLWGGDREMDSEDLKAVRRYAEFIREQKRRGK